MGLFYSIYRSPNRTLPSTSLEFIRLDMIEFSWLSRERRRSTKYSRTWNPRYHAMLQDLNLGRRGKREAIYPVQLDLPKDGKWALGTRCQQFCLCNRWRNHASFRLNWIWPMLCIADFVLIEWQFIYVSVYILTSVAWLAPCHHCSSRAIHKSSSCLLSLLKTCIARPSALIITCMNWCRRWWRWRRWR